MSRALSDFEARLNDVQQLLDAHEALTKFRRAEAALAKQNAQLQDLAKIIDHLVTDPGKGARKEVHALNNSGIVLLSAHLQGYLLDLFKEAAHALLNGRVEDVEAIINSAYTRGNPNPQNIKTLFGCLGFADIFDGISWQKMSTQSLKKKLKDLNETRNRIAHGSNERVTKAALSNQLSVVKNFATRIDKKLCEHIIARTSNAPW